MTAGAIRHCPFGCLPIAGACEWVYSTSEHSASMWVAQDSVFLPVNLSQIYAGEMGALNIPLL